MPSDPELYIHKSWLGFLQPVGLVVSPAALLELQAVVDRSVHGLQEALQALVRIEPTADGGTRTVIPDFPEFTRKVLGWEETDLVGAPFPETVEHVLPGEILRPTWAVPDPDRPGQFLMLVKAIPTGDDPDEVNEHECGRGSYRASPELRLERLLRGTNIPIGLLFNGTSLRLVYAPSKENSGHVTFPVHAMLEVQGRLILGALHMLLNADRLFVMPTDRRLPALLARSRDYQSLVSTALSDQVFDALGELLRGFQSADRLSQGLVFGNTMTNEPDHIYGGLLTVMMRLIFLLYAEDKGLVPQNPVYARNYAIAGLFERLREDAARYPDTMDIRYGAWTWLLTLFRMIYKGGSHGDLRLPERQGDLFNPMRFPFLEGRPKGDGTIPDTFEPPRVADGVIHRILERLLMLKGERLSYRTLDVEHLGSVYEAMMGYALERTGGPAVALTPNHVVVDMGKVLEQAPANRAKWLLEKADCKIDGKAGESLKDAKTTDEVLKALSRKISPRTQLVLPPDTLYLQPGEERRRSGSHYTPRKLTEPIVRTALRPVLEALGPDPTPAQVLEIKVCDPAMGSGAFLVEACRQLGEVLAGALERHGLSEGVVLPSDETMQIYAKRRVAECCLYGVDKNPFAVNLAKLSLWLETLAREQPFTFVDHALRHGDSLVGLTKEQIRYFNWLPTEQEPGPLLEALPKQTSQAAADRRRIHSLGEGHEALKSEALKQARTGVERARLLGDLVVSAYFSADKDKARNDRRRQLSFKAFLVEEGKGDLEELSDVAEALREGKRPLPPFHWELEFPEVFERENPGFDCVVGNPPFLGGSRISTVLGSHYLDWVLTLHAGSHGNGDLVAHFFRRGFTLLRQHGTLGLIATNTIAQGDTRSTGLRWICEHGGTIYDARKRVKWPGLAAVVVSVVHFKKGPIIGSRRLDHRAVSHISAFLFHAGGHESPTVLEANAEKSFLGSKVYGQGFIFDDLDQSATHLAEMHRLIEKDPRNAERIFPYIGGEEVNSSPTHAHHRYVINFGEMTEEEARRWPDLMGIVEEKVKPSRLAQNREIRAKYWWRFGETTPALFRAVAGLERVLVIARHQPQWCVAFMNSARVFSEALVIVAEDRSCAETMLQSRVHEIWARFFGSSMKDDLRYTPSDCFETFPFPANWEQNPTLEAAGQTYYSYRAQLMVDHNEGLTATYNRFHDPDEQNPRIHRLRELHAAMDQAVLEAYGWSDIDTTCGFGLDYLELDEDVKLPADLQALVDAGDLFFTDAYSAAEFDAEVRRVTGSKRKLPWRLRWPEAVHDEVLARLLELNQERAKEERLLGEAAKSLAKPAPVSAPVPKSTPKPTPAPSRPAKEARQMALVKAPQAKAEKGKKTGKKEEQGELPLFRDKN